MHMVPTHTPAGEHDTSTHRDRRQVVVGVEASDDNRAVIEWAAKEAFARQAPLTLVHTWEWEGVPVWATPYHYLRKTDVEHEGEQILARAAQHAIDAGAHDVHVVTQRGYAPDVLVAMTAQASLLVVGTRHASALARGVFGSVSTSVVSEARCPVIVLTGAQEPPGAAGGPDGACSQVVVGLAGGYHDQSLLEFGFDFAGEHGLKLVAVYCWESTFGSIALPAPDAAKRQLAESIAGWRERYPEVETNLVARRGAPVGVLVEASASQAMLVVGRHRPRLRLGAVLGSTMLGVVHHARCPVAVIPPATDRRS